MLQHTRWEQKVFCFRKKPKLLTYKLNFKVLELTYSFQLWLCLSEWQVDFSLYDIFIVSLIKQISKMVLRYNCSHAPQMVAAGQFSNIQFNFISFPSGFCLHLFKSEDDKLEFNISFLFAFIPSSLHPSPQNKRTSAVSFISSKVFSNYALHQISETQVNIQKTTNIWHAWETADQT